MCFDWIYQYSTSRHVRTLERREWTSYLRETPLTVLTPTFLPYFSDSTSRKGKERPGIHFHWFALSSLHCEQEEKEAISWELKIKKWELQKLHSLNLKWRGSPSFPTSPISTCKKSSTRSTIGMLVWVRTESNERSTVDISPCQKRCFRADRDIKGAGFDEMEIT